MQTALFLVTTSLQASIAAEVIKDLEMRRFDVLFFTRRSTPSIRRSFKKLAQGAQNSRLISAPVSKPDTVVQLSFYIRALATLNRWRNSYDHVVFGSIDSPFITGLARQSGGTLITVDDGTSNFLPESSYFTVARSFRNMVQRELFSSIDQTALREKIVAHYTIFPELDNIVGRDKLKSALLWGANTTATYAEPEITFAIGVAETSSKSFSPAQVQSLREYLQTRSVDYFVPHPLQRKSLLPEVCQLDKKGLLGEEAILETAGENAIHLIGPMSTIFLTLRTLAHRKTLLIPKGHEHYLHLGRRIGCHIVLLD